MSEIITDFIQTKRGYCHYEIEQGKNPIIWNLYVHSQYRKQGHARELLQYCIDQIRKTGYTGEIDIEPDPRDGTISYEKLCEFYVSLGLRLIFRDELQDMKSEDLPGWERGCGGDCAGCLT